MKRRRLGLWSILILMVLLILRSKAVQAGVRSGLALCGRVLIPALFPFSVLSGLLLRSGGAAALGAKADGWMRRRFHLPGQAAAPLLTGLMGGYPLGAQSLAALYKAGGMTKSEAVALSAFCNHPGPAFLVGAVGASVLGEPTLGLWLWGVTVCSALLTGILFYASGLRHPRPLFRASGGGFPVQALSPGLGRFPADGSNGADERGGAGRRAAPSDRVSAGGCSDRLGRLVRPYAGRGRPA